MGRKELERYFRKYPDVVTLPDFCQMLGGICDGTARKLLQEQLVEHYVIRTTYYIPKKYVIDYVLSPHYLELRKKLKAKLPIRMPKGGNENELP